ncbi:hypothetical protein V1503_19385 [Bacillus sp. SCS-151]|uniref:hypothetical protein n=1 Tax=Nanhaiella sioensis TaxID=3115293 RepID=UPI00397B3F3B
MSRLYNTFEFVGNLYLNDDKFLEVKESDSGWVGKRLNFAVQESKNNSVFIEYYGGYSKSKANVVFTFGKSTEYEKGEKLEIPWEDRKKQETIEMVADFKKFIVDFTTQQEVKEKAAKLRYEIRSIEYKDEITDSDKVKLSKLKKELETLSVNRKEFIHELDAVEYLAENLNTYKKHKFRLTGNIEINEWNGKFYRKFKPTLIEIVEDDTPNQLRGTMDIFFIKGCIDDKDFEDEKKVFIDGYIIDYDNNAKKDVFYPQQFILNAQKLDFENELHVKRFNFIKNKFDVKNKKSVYHLQWVVSFFRGADVVEFTYDDLTSQQKESVDIGLAKVEDFKPKGQVLGESVEENRLIKPLLQIVNDQNDFRDGVVESSYEPEDLDYVAVERKEKKEEVTEKSSETIKPDADFDDLFS